MGTIVRRILGVVVGVLLAVHGSALLAHADSRITADIKVVPSGRPLTDEEKRAVSFSAGRILKHVDQARRAIAKQDKSTALMQIDKGLSLVKIIEQTIPPTLVKATIKAGHLQYQDEDQVKSLTVPIYQELDTVSIMEPVVAAQKAASTKDGKTAKNVPAKDKLEELGADYASITLNVGDAKAHLENAKAALTKGKFDAAAKDLATIQEGVTIAYALENGPLVDAREDLVLAQIHMDAGLRKEAQLALNDASASLTRYAKAGGKYQEEAQNIRAEIAALTKEIEQSKEGPLEKVKEKIMGWWDRVRSWEARHL